ncbi:MAG: hypothetical protein R2707_00395 [Acidimicrobiales bacterium]
MKTSLKLVAAIAALMLFASSCGDDGGGGGGNTASADDPLVQAIVDDIMAGGDGVTTDRAEAECFVGGVVGEIGTARLNALGVTETNIAALDEIEWTEDEARSVVDSMFSCVDVTASFVDDMDFGELDDSQAECVRGIFSEDVLKDFMVSTFTGDEDAMSGIFALMGQVQECGIDVFGG